MIPGRQSGHTAPGSVFPEGRTTVTYIATDPTGNSQLCDVFITVEGKVLYFLFVTALCSLLSILLISLSKMALK